MNELHEIKHELGRIRVGLHLHRSTARWYQHAKALELEQVLQNFGGVIGAFNCQGAGWCPQERKIKAYPHFYEPICGFVSPKDVEWSQKHEAAAMGNAEEYAVYLNQSNTLLIMKSEKFSRLPITLQPSSFELFTIVPVQTMSSTVKFAPIGLLNMYNSGGAIEGVSYGEDWVKVEVKGSGKFCAYASEKPMACKLNGEEVGVEWILGINSYDKGNCSRLLIDFPWIEGGLSTLHLVFSST